MARNIYRKRKQGNPVNRPTLYTVFGRKTGTQGITQVAAAVIHETATVLIERESRPRIVKEGRKYVRFFDWQWMAMAKHRDDRIR